MDPTSFRMRHLLAVVVVAGITAAVLRHFFHVHVGFSREEIRTGALIAAAVGILLAIIITPAVNGTLAKYYCQESLGTILGSTRSQERRLGPAANLLD